MLRLVGFGDNAGSGFPTILDVWKSEGWIKPELIEDTNPVSYTHLDVYKRQGICSKRSNKTWIIATRKGCRKS